MFLIEYVKIRIMTQEKKFGPTLITEILVQKRNTCLVYHGVQVLVAILQYYDV